MTAAVLVGQDLVEDHGPEVCPIVVLGASGIEAGDACVADDQVFVMLPAVVPELDLNLLVIRADTPNVLGVPGPLHTVCW
ncbi:MULTISPECIES: hypothetical protein [unclassified Streptomyces]|uniref:hypothetical protein n=1 Tax=unclassified Streptomyces TaxID=2593676 RepID=UPI0022565DDE|nr:hypothetical protein [Streptomyces sp. NBC_00160]MCX5308153.1 hypothetical protein [Streptomyces sp. NBC_00160]